MDDRCADDAENLEILRSLADAIDARDRASLAILETLRGLKTKPWFARWCEDHGIQPDEVTTTAKAVQVIRRVLGSSAVPHNPPLSGTQPKLLQ